MDAPIVGFILCTNKDKTIVNYSVLSDEANPFASRYRLYFPAEAELKQLIEQNRIVLGLDGPNK